MLFNASSELDALSVQINIIINTAEIEKTKRPKVVLLESLFGNEWDRVFSPSYKDWEPTQSLERYDWSMLYSITQPYGRWQI